MKQAKKLGILSIFFVILLTLLTGMKGQAIEYKFNMSYIFFSNSSKYTDMVDNTQNSLNEVSPSYFALDYDGDLALSSTISESFVTEMHSRGITVVPYLTNDWSRAVGKTALAKKEALAKDLASAINLYNLDGVNIDIENVTTSEREAYVDFVRLLRAQLTPGKTIAVAVAANPWGISTGWQGSYDYTELAKYCDYLMIMGYDEHYYGGPAGPVSSMSFLDKSLKYAVSSAPKEKIVLGLPFYGRIWGSGDSLPNGYGLTNTRIAQLINNYGGEVEIDPASLSTKAMITIGEEDNKPVISGETLEAGTYTIWYESEQSIKAKLELVEKYGIKGTGSWALGQETSNTWNYYKLWLNNCKFTDIQDSWAREYILNAYLNNWVTGCSADNFSPDEPLTRAQAAVILVRRLGLTPALQPAYSFDDCIGTWAQPYLETARKYHIISGIGDNLFDPDRPVTRQEIAVMINNILKNQSAMSGDVASILQKIADPWTGATIDLLCSGVENGRMGDSTHGSNDITRAEMTVFIAKLPVS